MGLYLSRGPGVLFYDFVVAFHCNSRPKLWGARGRFFTLQLWAQAWVVLQLPLALRGRDTE
jgi:hypothetical protein